MTIRPSTLQRPGVIAGMSTRIVGNANDPFGMNLSFSVGDDPVIVQKNRESFFGGLGIGLEEIAVPGQVHSALVRRVDAPGLYRGCDGLVTDRERLFLCVTVADCVPILLFEPRRRVVATIHAGWRGTVSRIVKEGVRLLSEEYGANPRAMLAFIGPAAGGCCYEIGQEVAERIDPRFVVQDNGHYRADLKEANREQLEEAGLTRQNIEIHPGCTIMHPELFHSYRRDATRSGRMMAVIGLVPMQ